MGQCYTVDALLKYINDDPSSFCGIVKEMISKRNGITADFNLEGKDLTNPFDCFKALTSNRAEEEITNNGKFWYANFDGSYGWGSVMIDIFEKAFITLDEGSYVVICPWEEKGVHRIFVEKDKVYYQYTEVIK